MVVFYTVCLSMIWWWCCKVGVCLPHFLRSVFFRLLLPACDIIFMCPVLTNKSFRQQRCRSQDRVGSNENVVYISDMSNGMHFTHLKKRMKLKYFLSSCFSWFIATPFSVLTSFVSKVLVERNEWNVDCCSQF